MKFPYYDSYIYVIFMSSLMLSGHHGRDKGGTCTPESEQEAEVDRVVGAAALGRDPCKRSLKLTQALQLMHTVKLFDISISPKTGGDSTSAAL